MMTSSNFFITMFLFNMQLQIKKVTGSVVAKLARIPYAQMPHIFVPLQATRRRCRIVALITRVLNALVFVLFVHL